MSKIDAGEPSELERAADRLDIWKLAYAELKDKEWETGLDACDVARLAEFLVAKEE